MSVVAASQFKLARAQKSLEKSYLEGDWEAIKLWDKELAESLNALFEDGECDAKALITQLESVLVTYSKIVSELPAETSRHLS